MTQANLETDSGGSGTQAASSEAAAGVELSVVIPTYNERENITPLIRLLESALPGIAWEAIFVDDDSPDNTSELIREIGRVKPNIRCLQRINRRGLSTAVTEGILSSGAPFVAVMDADLQHDERLLPNMLETLKSHEFDLVVGSRFVEGGGAGGFSLRRLSMTRLAAKVSRLVTKAQLSDPMSGFFMIRRDVFYRVARDLSGQGFKILLDVFASSKESLRFKELPYEFKNRLHGKSKLDTLVLWEYLLLVLDKVFGRVLPVRFVMFAIVGGSGAVLHMLTLWFGYQISGLTFFWSQIVATVVSMTSNFVLNNLFTYRDTRLRGWSYVRGLLTFYLICSVGAFANVGIANVFFESDFGWWVAGFAGAVVGVVWNYAVSSIFTWRT